MSFEDPWKWGIPACKLQSLMKIKEKKKKKTLKILFDYLKEKNTFPTPNLVIAVTLSTSGRYTKQIAENI